MWRDWKAGRPIVWLGHLALCPAAAAIASRRHSILLFRFPLLRPSLALTHTHSLLYAWNTHAHLNYSFGVDESRPLAASGEGGYDDNLGTATPSFAFVTTATAAHTHNICRACMWAAPNDRQEYYQLRRSISSQPNILSAPSLLIEAD